MGESDFPLALTTLLNQQSTIQQDVSAMREASATAAVRLENIDVRTLTLASARDDHEGRIRALERFRFTLAGVSILGGVGAGWVGYLLGHIVH